MGVRVKLMLTVRGHDRLSVFQRFLELEALPVKGQDFSELDSYGTEARVLDVTWPLSQFYGQTRTVYYPTVVLETTSVPQDAYLEEDYFADLQQAGWRSCS